MKPAVLAGDVVSVWRLNRTPERGEVFAVRHATTGEIVFSRVVGLPGDTIGIHNGVPVINGSEAVHTPLEPFSELMEPQGPLRQLPLCANGAVGQGAVCLKNQFQETLDNGASYPVLSVLNNGIRDRVELITVPEGYYYLLGDNRDNARDSRIAATAGGLGLVSKDAVIGRVLRILYSFDGRSPIQFWTWSPMRLFKAVE